MKGPCLDESFRRVHEVYEVCRPIILDAIESKSLAELDDHDQGGRKVLAVAKPWKLLLITERFEYSDTELSENSLADMMRRAKDRV